MKSTLSLGRIKRRFMAAGTGDTLRLQPVDMQAAHWTPTTGLL